MAEDRLEPREFNFRQYLPWTQIFRGFWVAIDPKKLLLAALGILTMAFGWWLLAVIFFSPRTAPDWRRGNYADTDEGWRLFKRDRDRWNTFYAMAGPGGEVYDANDIASTRQEFEQLVGVTDRSPEQVREDVRAGKLPSSATRVVARERKAYGRLRVWPWFENRGPNPFLLLSGRAGLNRGNTTGPLPWAPGQFGTWFLGYQAPYLLEPLVKLVRPIRYFLHPNAGPLDRFYYLLVAIWTIATWAIFGGAITRIAAVQVARNEKIGLGEALRFTLNRWRSYLFASFAPLIGIAFFFLVLILGFGLPTMLPVVAEFWDGLLWPVVILIGLVIAFLLIGLVGWPLIHATLSAEGSDSFDALSRSYSYVLQNPWSYLWYAAVALVYGAVIMFFVGLVGSLAVYLGKWGVSNFPYMEWANRDPSYMFIWAPTSFEWRDVLLRGQPVTSDAGFRWWNYIGTALVTFWLYLAFLVMIGIGYSFFWSTGTIIYLLMRRKVDDTEMDEVYLEEEEDDSYSAPAAPTATPANTAPPTQLQMVEPPALRTATPAAPAGEAPAAEPAPRPPEGTAGPAGVSP